MAARADLVHRYPTNGVFEQLVFFDGQILRLGAFVPHDVLFAAHWWLPTLFLFLAFPAWFKLMGLSTRYGWFAAGLIALSPANAWWSLLPVHMMAYTAAGCALMIAAFRAFEQMRRVRGSLLAIAAGILIAGMPSSYAPWAILLGTPLLVASTLFVLTRKASLRPRLVAVGITAGAAVVFGLGTLWENRAGLSAMTGTVYPGGRRSIAEPQPFGQIFDAPHLWQLLRSVPSGINSSELSTSFTVLFFVAALLFAVSWRAGGWLQRIPELTMACWAALWLAWMTLPLGEWSRSFPLFSLIPPYRVSQVIGMVAVVLVALLLARMRGDGTWRLALTAGIACGAVTVYAGELLRSSELPDLTVEASFTSAALVAFAVIVLVKFPHRVWPLTLICVLALIPVVRVNPVIAGVGDLRASSTAEWVANQAATVRESGKLWASNDPALNTLLLANGIPSLSGLQRSGPNLEAWRRLDPSGAESVNWNRGGGYIFFSWTPGAPTKWDNNDFDAVGVAIDPCTLGRAWPELDRILSTEPVTASCLTLDHQMIWQDKQVFVYGVRL
ncbi:hypothetical protein [Arthrobacter sp. 754]|uniref:DUF7657 domain-containing protein n=1 Tax=Arthrobacter sp. 754 TaxID=3156315 RepID=UPI0033932653